jgi:hypothetical protein
MMHNGSAKKNKFWDYVFNIVAGIATLGVLSVWLRILYLAWYKIWMQ